MTHAIDQYLESALVGDATTDHALIIQRWLIELGFESNIYAEGFQPDLEGAVRPASSYWSEKQDGLLIYHHSTGSVAADRLIKEGRELILIYHNITPPEFFTSMDQTIFRRMRLGREQLTGLRQQTKLALGASDYSEKELQEFGYSQTDVLPIVLKEELYQNPAIEELKLRYRDQGPILLFIGRLAPNKKPEDLIKLLYFYRRIEPDAILLLVGNIILPKYVRWMKEFSRGFELEEAVIFTGRVSHAQMISYYQLADFYVSMSEHEGFGKPLIESMYFDLPVIAYKAAAVPYTMAQSGVLFQRKHYEALAEVVNMLNKDQDFRQKIISNQNIRLADFLETNVRAYFEQLLESWQLL